MSAEAQAVPETLADLVGEHVLDYAPRTDLRHPFDADASGVMFSLDGRNYLLFEDPSDGYRSTAAALVSFAGTPSQLGDIYPDRLKARVFCSMGEGSQAELLYVRDAANGKTVLIVGTDNRDDYYPSYTATWSPENLAANAGEPA